MKTPSLLSKQEFPRPSWLRVMACVGILTSLPSCSDRTLGEPYFELDSLPTPEVNCHPRVVEPCTIFLESSSEGEIDHIARVRGRINDLTWIIRGDQQQVLVWTNAFVSARGQEAVLHNTPLDENGRFDFDVQEGIYEVRIMVEPLAEAWVEADWNGEGDIVSSAYPFQVVNEGDLFEDIPDEEEETD